MAETYEVKQAEIQKMVLIQGIVSETQNPSVDVESQEELPNTKMLVNDDFLKMKI